jgi:hypothetical protein
MLRSPLVRNEVVQVRQADQIRRLTATRVMKALHGERLPVDGVVRLIQQRAHRRHLGVFEHRISARFLVLDPVADSLAALLTCRGRDVVDQAA